MNRSQNFQNLQNLFLWYGDTQPGCRRKAGRLAAFHPNEKGCKGFAGFVTKIDKQ